MYKIDSHFTGSSRSNMEDLNVTLPFFHIYLIINTKFCERLAPSTKGPEIADN